MNVPKVSGLCEIEGENFLCMEKNTKGIFIHWNSGTKLIATNDGLYIC
jgi:hypothetical protein